MQQARVIFEEQTTSFFRVAYPSTPLRSVVAYYFEIDLTTSGHQPLHLRSLPNVNGRISVGLSDVGWLSQNETTGSQRLIKGANLFGRVSEPLASTYPTGAHEFYIKLKPGAILQLTQLTENELANQFALLSDTIKLPHFTERVQQTSTFTERMATAESALLPFVTNTSVNWRYSLVHQAISCFDENDVFGDHLYTICRDLGVSYTSLHRHFTTVIGYSPKYCQQLIRLKKALKHYKAYGSTFAYDTIGYTDFSHFVRTCKLLAHRGPSALL